MGSGRQNTVIRPTSGQIGLLASGLYRCSLSHLTLDLSNITTGGIGIHLLNCVEMLLEDVAIINMPQTVTAIQIEGQANGGNAYAVMKAMLEENAALKKENAELKAEQKNTS